MLHLQWIGNFEICHTTHFNFVMLIHKQEIKCRVVDQPNVYELMNIYYPLIYAAAIRIMDGTVTHEQTPANQIALCIYASKRQNRSKFVIWGLGSLP